MLDRLIGKSDIKSKTGVSVAISSGMSQAIELWSQLYTGKAPWVSEEVSSLNLPAGISSLIARMVTIELKTQIDGSARAEFLNAQYQRVAERLKEYCEVGCAKGGLAFKPYCRDGLIFVDAVQADRFFPTRIDSTGRIVGAVFVESMKKGSKYYTRLELHDLTGTGYHITNRAFRSESSSVIGSEVSLDTVDDWADIEPESTIKNIKAPLFAYFKMPLANTVDAASPLGVSVYAHAIDQIKEADKQYSRFLWENEGGELAIDADVTLFTRDANGNPILPKGKKRLFRALNMDDAKEQLKVFSPTLRAQSLLNGLNKILQLVEFNCGLAYGTISDLQNVDKTATEIKSSKQQSYALVSDIQKSLQNALEQLVYAMDVWASVLKLAPKGPYEISFNWDDSIIVDAESNRQIMLQEVQSGIRSPLSYFMEYYGVTEEEAKKMMPAAQGITE